jgi:hypothetical protein
MADRGFRVKEDVMVVQARLVIPPSTCGNLAMSSGDVSETSRIANGRIYVKPPTYSNFPKKGRKFVWCHTNLL